MTGTLLAAAETGFNATPWIIGIFVLLVFLVLLAITWAIGGGRPHE
jgi:hypothetical protein